MSIMAQHKTKVPLATLAAVVVWTGIQLGSLEVSAQPIYSPQGCRGRIGRIQKRRRCVACVRRAGMVFHKQGAGIGRCRHKAAHVPAPAVIRAAPGCRARIGRVSKRRRCIACVRRGGVFHKRGAAAGFCRGGAKPAPAPDIVRAEPGCAARVVRPAKRQRCLSCIHRGGVFHKQGGGAGFCRGGVAAVLIRAVPGCRARIGRVNKRRRCVACVRRGGVFHKRGAAVGFCAGGAPVDQIRTKPGCAARVGRLSKRQRCMVCVGRGGVFHKRGAAAGFCRGGAPLAPKGVIVRTRPGCVTHIGRVHKRRRCVACVRRGGAFHRQGGAAGFCEVRKPAPPPPAAGPIRAEPGCVARIGRVNKRRRCIACVRRGGVFHKRGAAHGFCAGPAAPRPHVGIIRSVHGCRTRIGRLSKRRRCIACVRRGAVFHKRGAAHGFCR